VTALDRYLGSRCTCDVITLGCGWLPGHCPHANCRNWDWRDLEDNVIEGPLSQHEVAALLGVSRQYVSWIESKALPRFINQLHGEMRDGIKPLPDGWWRQIAAISLEERRQGWSSVGDRQLLTPELRAQSLAGSLTELSSWRRAKSCKHCGNTRKPRRACCSRQAALFAEAAS